jgi:enoyl-CoA hydratase/carnithine racemase
MTSRSDVEARTTAGGPIVLEFRDCVAEIGLCNGPLNLVTRDMLRAFNRALDDVDGHADVRCLVVHGGSARAFCAGSDINEFAQIRRDASEQKILFEDMVLRRLARMPMPTIAAIDGPALGGGLEIALACDLRLCRRGITVGLTESRLGGLAGNGALRAARLIGPARTKELVFTGATLDADEALAWGLVNRVVDGSAIEGARALAAVVAARGPLSNRLAKTLVDAAFDMPLDAALSLSTVAQQRIFDSDDLHEGVAAFFAKRAPQFTGR